MNCRLIAYYLPQFHPIPENDAWWGAGFTEWTNVAKAKPLFRGHEQPRIPADLGFYDLRLPETRIAQASLAREAGIEGFCYYHYWFGNGKQLLERPFNEVVSSGEPDFPFCLCWANHSWGGSTWTNATSKVAKKLFVEQTYPGDKDNEAHFYSLLDAFKDKRYIKVDGKPLFVIYDPLSFKDIDKFVVQWNDLAKINGLGRFHFVGNLLSSNFNTMLKKSIKHNNTENDVKELIDSTLDLGFDAITTDNKYRAQVLSKGILFTGFHSFLSKKFNIVRPEVYNQEEINKHILLDLNKEENIYPIILPNWDRTPRSKSDSIYVNSTPGVFSKLLKKTIDMVSSKQEEHRIIFIKSWNEWGEGNYVEPDQQYGHGYLDAIRDVVKK